MTKWLRTLDLKDLWKRFDEAEITVDEVAEQVGKRLRDMRPLDDIWLDEKRLELADDFECVDEDDVQAFDYIMHDLYDWADTKVAGQFFDAQKVCWVATQF